MKVLIGAGDVGGARAILPGLLELARTECRFDILDHGYLARHAEPGWARFQAPTDATELKIRLRDYQAYVFGTSVHDTWPLRLARISRDCGIAVVCVLDNWMNYRWRLGMDGEGVLWPEAYAVMDELARQEAIADGVPESILHVTGHPALAGLRVALQKTDRAAVRKSLLGDSAFSDSSRRFLVFVSEPVEKDQGSDHNSPGFRGYTEKTVLPLLCDSLQDHASYLQIGLLPHPRENAGELMSIWEQSRRRLQGGILKVNSGREAILAADAVCGMASILLFESMLAGKPTVSLQPNLALPALEFLRKKGLPFFLTNEQTARHDLHRWLQSVLSSTGERQVHPELALHDQAPSALAKLICDVASRRGHRI